MAEMFLNLPVSHFYKVDYHKVCRVQVQIHMRNKGKEPILPKRTEVKSLVHLRRLLRHRF